MRDGKKEIFEFLIIMAVIVLSFLIFNSAQAEDLGIRSQDLNRYILESNVEGRSSVGGTAYPSVSRKLDWVSDVMTNRDDIFIQSNNYDKIEDDPSYAKRMLRRAFGKEAARVAQDSELKSLYKQTTEFFKEAQNMFSVNEDMGPDISKSDSGSTTKRRILVFGLDGSNQFSPTLTLFDKLKMSYEPLSDRVITEIGWEF